MFTDNPRGDGGDWSVDWPRADINLSIRLSELTKTTVGRAPSGDPSHLLMRLTDETLFRCPFIMMTEVGSLYVNDEEAERLREYLLKGGFLWADDFWGSYAWEVWEEEIHKVLPASEYQIVDVPLNHPLFRSQFEMKDGAPQISAIGNWQRGVLSERGETARTCHVRAIVDKHDRIMVLITHNTDFGDSYEREGDNPVLLPDVGARLRLRNQCHPLCDDSLTRRIVPAGAIRHVQRDADDRRHDQHQRREQFEEENSKTYGNASATSSAGNCRPDTATTMNCLPLT